MRVLGLETEYGVVDLDNPAANPILLASTLVAAYRARPGTASASWDYGGEDPLHDQRGFWRDRASAHPDLLTDAPESGAPDRTVTRRRRRGLWEDPSHLNAVLANGSRFYVDHAHPEISGPEVTNPRDAVLWDRAADAIALQAVAAAGEEGLRIALYKNNVDGKGASYGTHENYLVTRAVPFDDLARRLTSHLVTRQVYTGAGRVGLGQRGELAGFQISQRADYMEAEVGLETTLRRPIINTRDEPHADPSRWRRLHVIIGDANAMDVPTYLKFGTTSLVLAAIEAGDERLDLLILAEPVDAVIAVSRDLSLRAPLPLADGSSASAVDIQRALLEIARDYARDAEEALVIARWEDLLARLARDPLECGRDVEWVAKLGLLNRIRERNATATGLPAWDDARLVAADIHWSDLDPSRGLCSRLSAAGAVERLVTDEEIARAIAEPPRDTRAWLRGRMVGKRPDIVDAAGWATVVLDQDPERPELDAVRLDDPLATTHPLLDALLSE